jgi:hypothetical protein
LRELKDASAKAADILAENCPADQPLTPTGRLAAMEQRLSALLQAIDTVQPALAKFYNSLSDQQKAQLNRLAAFGPTNNAWPRSPATAAIAKPTRCTAARSRG